MVEAWDAPPAALVVPTTAYADGVREVWLVARGDGGVGADAIRLQVDNHAPVISSLGLREGFVLDLEIVEEGAGVALGEVRWEGGAAPVVGPPWLSILGCHAGPIEVVVTDRAGWEGRLALTVDTGVDDDPFGDAVDGDCDGVDGTDRDGDGVPGSATGEAPDCDDDDPLVHGYWGDWSAPRRFGPYLDGDAPFRVAALGDRLAIAYLAWDGGLWVARGTVDGLEEPVELAPTWLWWDDAPHLQIDADGVAHVAWRSTDVNEIVYATIAGPVPEVEGIAIAENVLGLVLDAEGTPHVLLWNGGQIHHAWRDDRGWWSQLVPDATIEQGWPSFFLDGDQLVVVTHGLFGAPILVSRLVDGFWQSTWEAAVDWLGQAALDDGEVVFTSRTDADLQVWGGRFGAWPGTTLPMPSFARSALAIGADGRVQVVIQDRNQPFTTARWIHDGLTWHREPVAMTPRIAVDEAGRARGAFVGSAPGAPGTVLYYVVEGTPVAASGCPTAGTPAPAARPSSPP
jgi:hypothetical protein